MANKKHLSISKIFILFLSLFMAGSAYSDHSCMVQRHVIKTINGQVCASQMAVPVCVEGCVAESSEIKEYLFKCSTTGTLRAQVEVANSCVRPNPNK